MKSSKKQYWGGLEQLTNNPEFVKNLDREFPVMPSEEEQATAGSTRRDFLKMMGFSVAAASLASCEAPVRKAIPYLNKPVDVDPGIPNYYASTYIHGGDYCSILVKTREGRPIKIEGNQLSKITKGGTSPQVEASVLSLYDKERLTEPYIKGKISDWATLDKEVITQLSQISSKGGQIRIVSNTLLSPTTQAVINDFVSKYPTARHIMYDAWSAYGMLKANEISFGKAIIPNYHFDKAEVIVSFSADFLGDWLNAPSINRAYALGRKVSKDAPKMSRHYQYESVLSLTGANADYRIPIRPSQEGLIVAQLYNLIATKSGVTTVQVPAVNDVKFLEKAAEHLWKSKGRSLVISGSNDPQVQLLVNAINHLLENYMATIDVKVTANYRKGSDEQLIRFVGELMEGKIEGVIFYNCNPVYNHPSGSRIAEALKNTAFSLSTSDRMDETTSLVQYVAPDHHFLESWNDAEPVTGHLSLGQPAITPLFHTRQAQESFLTWAEAPVKIYYDYLQNRWKEKYFNYQRDISDFQVFWDKNLHDGVFEYPVITTMEMPVPVIDILPVGEAIAKNYKPDNTDIELVFYLKVAIGDGSAANNPWLQEMPDPISKACWDNYLTIPQSMAKDLGITMFESQTYLAEVTINGSTLTVPVLIQPGQAKGTVGLALGYGRTRSGKVGDGVGVNVYPFLSTNNGYVSNYMSSGITIKGTSQKYNIPHTQTHHTYMSRHNVIQEACLSEYKEDPWAGRYIPEIVTSEVFDKSVGDGKVDRKVRPSVISLWKGHEYNNHHWGMVIDLNSCTGCGTCTIACQVENNVPVVGREEVINRREMHWIRIDRYYSSEAPVEDLKGLEVAAENPEITFQPMLCQHCNNAPCETVCPVSATTHSTEGLNQMTYNRCIGTRYCANNCPYKVRRFNWFKYFQNRQFDKNSSMNNDLGRMVLNPDVTVRSRGVMEKCSFCIQRIQAGKLEAKKEGRRPMDGEVVSACASACPAEAIVFGDLNDPESRISKVLKATVDNKLKMAMEERAYHVLEEVNTRPNIWYMTKIRNKDLEDKKV